MNEEKPNQLLCLGVKSTEAGLVNLISAAGTVTADDLFYEVTELSSACSNR
jgi:hypothetical protein